MLQLNYYKIYLASKKYSIFLEIEGIVAFKIESHENLEEDKDVSENNDTTSHDLESIIDCALSLTRFTNEHLRVGIMIEKAIKERSQRLSTFEEITINNSFEWIAQKKCDLIILMPTHDARTRDPKRGVAYFDPTVKYPEREGTYPGDESITDSPHLLYALENESSGYNSLENRIEIYNPNRLSEQNIQEILKKSIGDLITIFWTKSIGALNEIGALQYNPIHSLRIHKLLICLLEIKEKNSNKKNLTNTLKKLDEYDSLYLSNHNISYYFWNFCQEFFPREVYEALVQYFEDHHK